MARLVADKVEANPQFIRVAQDNLNHWIRMVSSTPDHLEWQQILALLRAPTQEGQRLRQSNPFAGLLTPPGALANISLSRTGSNLTTVFEPPTPLPTSTIS